MSRVVSVRLNEADDARLSGAAALLGLSLSVYIKRLLSDARPDAEAVGGKVLQRMEELAGSLAEIRTALAERQPATMLDLPPRALIARRLKERGLPSSTIRQIDAVLDEFEPQKSQGAKPA